MIEFGLGLAAGAFLGLLGGGGSVIAVPMLVYVLQFSAKAAIGTALAVVAVASVGGAYSQYRKGLVNVRLALIFGLAGATTSVAGALIARLLSDETQMYILALLMFVSAAAMIFQNKPRLYQRTDRLLPALTIAALVGLLTGIVGVGGGFVLVPALTLFLGLSAQTAIGTSLLIVAANSAAAAIAYFEYIPQEFSVFAFALGMCIACPMMGHIVKHLNETTLRRVFSALLLVIACFILIQEV